MDIYNRQVEYGDAFTSDKMTITFAGIGAGLLVQNLNTSYQQGISRVWELGSKKTYYIGGRTQGNFAIAKIAGPTALASSFLQTYGNICNAASNTMNLRYSGGWCRGSAATGFTLRNVVIQSVGISVAAADMIVNEALNGIFTSMETA